MKISFEVDEVLLTNTEEFPTEKQNIIQKVLRFEKLRLGAINLMREINLKGNEIWIYTSSSRPKHYLVELFFRHGIEISGVINRKKHVTTLSVGKRTLSKFPPGFGFDIIVDSSENVRIDSNIFGFKSIIVKPNDKNWTEKIRQELYSVPVQ